MSGKERSRGNGTFLEMSIPSQTGTGTVTRQEEKGKIRGEKDEAMAVLGEYKMAEQHTVSNRVTV